MSGAWVKVDSSTAGRALGAPSTSGRQILSATGLLTSERPDGPWSLLLVDGRDGEAIRLRPVTLDRETLDRASGDPLDIVDSYVALSHAAAVGLADTLLDLAAGLPEAQVPRHLRALDADELRRLGVPVQVYDRHRQIFLADDDPTQPGPLVTLSLLEPLPASSLFVGVAETPATKRERSTGAWLTGQQLRDLADAVRVEAGNLVGG